MQLSFVESAGTRKKRALSTSAEMKSYLRSYEMVIRSDGSSTASENTNIFNRGTKLSVDKCVVQRMPLLRTRVHPSRLVNRLVFEEGVGDDEVVVGAEVSESLSVLIQLVDCVGTNDAEAGLVLSSAHSGV